MLYQAKEIVDVFCGKSTVKAVVGIADELLKRQDKYKEVPIRLKEISLYI